MNSTAEFDTMISQMKDQAEIIESNRGQRNRKYNDCMNNYKEFLLRQTEMLESTDTENQQNKEMISKAFENTFSRILSSSDVTIRKIKQTYSQKKQFWDNVIKMNSSIVDLQLKKEFYVQKRSAEDRYFQAIDHQKGKHKTYAALMGKGEKKEHLREFQQTNKAFEERVIQGSNTLQQWQNISHYGNRLTSPSIENTIINKFMMPPRPNNNPQKPTPTQDNSSTLFLNNFTRKV